VTIQAQSPPFYQGQPKGSHTSAQFCQPPTNVSHFLQITTVLLPFFLLCDSKYKKDSICPLER
jgi:hypothetical protein